MGAYSACAKRKRWQYFSHRKKFGNASKDTAEEVAEAAGEKLGLF
jgi:hypothetical protein